jgi:hypothetical protein
MKKLQHFTGSGRRVVIRRETTCNPRKSVQRYCISRSISRITFTIGLFSRLDGLVIAYLSLDPKFAGSNLVKDDGFVRATSSGSIVSDYGLDDRAIGVRSPAGAEDFSSIICVQTGSGAHPASCTMGTGGPFPGGKSAAEA